MKKNNALKRTMAGALAIVSVAAYMPISAAVPVIANVAIQASALDYTYSSGQTAYYYEGTRTLAANDVLAPNVTIRRGNDNNRTWYGRDYRIFSVSGSTTTLVGTYHERGSNEGNNAVDNFYNTGNTAYRVVRIENAGAGYNANASNSAAIYLQAIYTLKVTLPEGASITSTDIAGTVENTDGTTTYELWAGSSYTITSNKTLSANTAGKLSVFYNGEQEGKYSYSLTVASLSETVADPIVFSHVHNLEFDNVRKDEDGNIHSDVLYLECAGETSPAISVAKLDIDSTYYYGEAPSAANVEALITAAQKAEYGIEGDVEVGDFYFMEENGSTHLDGWSDLVIDKTYVANAQVNVTYKTESGKEKEASYWLRKTFNYEKRPLSKCEVFLKQGETETPLTVSGNGSVTVPDGTFVFDETEHEPVIVVKQRIDGEYVVVDSYTISTDESLAEPNQPNRKIKNKATNAGLYKFALVANDDEGNNYCDELPVYWSIKPADFDIDLVANDEIIYDGQDVKWNEDFTVKGDNADLLTKASIEGTTGIVLVPAAGDNLKDAGTHNATLFFENPNYGEGELFLNVIFEIKPRPVKLTPSADQGIVYSELFEDSVKYDVEEFNESAKRGFVSGDLADGQTEAEFFGDQFVIKERIGVTSAPDFDSETRTNHAGTYKFAKNTNDIGAAGNLRNYDIEWVIVDENDEPVEVFTVEQKPLDELMFAFFKDKYTYYEEEDEGVVQTPIDSIVNGNNFQYGDFIGTYNYLTSSDFTVGGTWQAIFPGKFDVEFEATENGNYSGLVSLPWWIDANEGFSFTVSADDFIYNGKTIEENNKIKENPSDNTVKGITYSRTYYKIEKNDSDVEADWDYVKLDYVPAEAGDYKVVVSATKKGFDIEDAEDTFTINKKGVKITVDPSATSKVFGDPDPDFKYTSEVVKAEGDPESTDKVTVEGEIKIKDYDKKFGVYDYDLSGLKVYVNDVEDSSFAISTENKFTVTRRPIVDSNIIPEEDEIFFNENGMVDVPESFRVESKDADGNDAVLVRGRDYELVTGVETKVDNNQYSIQVRGIGNYKSAADATIKVGAAYQVSVTGGSFTSGKAKGESEAKFYKGDILSIKPNADDIPEGKKFGYWKDDKGKAIYNESHTFKVDRANMTFTAVYANADDEIESFAQAKFDSVTVENGKRKAVAKFSIPSGNNWKIKKAGFVASQDATIADTKVLNENTQGATIKYDGEGAEKQIGSVHNYDYTLTMSNPDVVWYVTPYLVYEVDGVEKTICGDVIVKVDKDGTVTYVKDAAPNTTITVGEAELINEPLNGVNTDKAKFDATFIIPPDCKIERAGFLLANSKLPEDEFVVGNNGVKINYTSADTTEPNVTVHTYKFTLKKKRDVDTALTWYARPYMIVTDSNGVNHTIYGSYNDIMEMTIPAKA